MKKILCALIVILFFSGESFSASPSELKRMSIFVSNFTEVGMMNFHVDDLSDSELAYFGIWHNFRNNYKSRIQHCRKKNCPYGSLIVDKSYVAESVKKYFNREIHHQNPSDSYGRSYGHYDGRVYHFEGASGECTWARVYNAEKRGNVIIMRGETYDPEHDIEGSTFTATAKPYKYNGKNTWSIISLVVDD